MKVGELFVELGAVVNSKTLKEFAGAIGNLPMDVAAGIAALAGLEYHLTKIAEEAMNTAVGFQMFSDQTGLSWKELQRWQIVAQQANVSTDAVASSVSSLERNLAEIKLGRGNAAPFQLLGIDPRQNAFQVLEQLRERIKGVSRPMATNLISQMGINPEMIRLLLTTNKEFAEMSQRVHGLSEGQMHDFLEARKTLVQWGMEFRQIMMDIVSHFTRAIEKSLEFKKILVGVGIALAALAVYFFPVTAAIVGLILVLDDLATYFTGGDSMTGRAIKGIKDLGKELLNLGFGGGGSKGGANAPSYLQDVKQGVLHPVDAVKNTFNLIVNGAGASAEAIGREITRQVAQLLGFAEQQTNNQGH